MSRTRLLRTETYPVDKGTEKIENTDENLNRNKGSPGPLSQTSRGRSRHQRYHGINGTPCTTHENRRVLVGPFARLLSHPRRSLQDKAVPRPWSFTTRTTRPVVQPLPGLPTRTRGPDVPGVGEEARGRDGYPGSRKETTPDRRGHRPD